MSLNAKQSLKGNLISSSNISGDIAIGTTYTIAGGEGGTPVIITTEKIEGGYRISLTDSVDTEVIDIMDGKDGAKGDPGNPGVYVGSDEAPEEYYIQIDPEGDAVEYIAPPTTAEVGQILSVKSVDENGKPTEWEVVDVASGGSGVTQAQAQALDNMFKKCAFTEDVSSEYEAFRVAFGIGDTPVEPDEPIEPDVPEVTITSISATYTGGEVYAGALMTDLTGITVKATYSDGSTKNVTGYTLSGTIVEGNNTITVSYGGKTTTFIVTGLHVEQEPTTDNDPPFDVMTWTEGLRLTGNKEYTGHTNYSTSSYVDVSNISSFNIARSDDVAGNVQYLVEFYNAEKVYIEHIGASYMNASNTTYPSNVIIEVPDGSVYCRICGTKLSGITFSELIRITVV